MRAILAPLPQLKGRICSLEHRLLCEGQLAPLSFQPPDSPHSALWRCQWVVPPPHPVIDLDPPCNVGFHIGDDAG